MNIARVVTEAPSSIRWRVGKLMSEVFYQRSFESFGPGSVIVRPRRLRGTERIRIGRDLAAYEDCWLEAEPGGRLVVGDRVYLGAGVHLHAVDDVTVGDRVMFADGVLVNSGMHRLDEDKTVYGVGPISIGDDCFVGQRAIVLGGVTVGAGSVIGAGAVVTKDVLPGTTVAGVPARVIGTAIDGGGRR